MTTLEFEVELNFRVLVFVGRLVEKRRGEECRNGEDLKNVLVIVAEEEEETAILIRKEKG